jgi:hypothetical protein
MPVAIGRRELIAALGSAAAWSLAARAQERPRGTQVFNGTATLIDPKTAAAVGTFSERCEVGGVATAEVVLLNPITLANTDFLGVYSGVFRNGVPVPVIMAKVSDPAGSSVSKFSGTSEVGCVRSGTKISLVRSPRWQARHVIDCCRRGSGSA